MEEATAKELIAALKENTAAVTRAAIAHEGMIQVLLEDREQEQEQGPAPAQTYMDGSPR